MRSILKNKRAQTWQEILYGIIAVVLLVLILALIFNWGGLRDRIFSPVGGKSTLDDKKSACINSCNLKRAVEYNAPQDITLTDGRKISLSCRDLESEVWRCVDKTGKILNLSQQNCALTNWKNNLCYNTTNMMMVAGVNTVAACNSPDLSFVPDTMGICINDTSVFKDINEASCKTTRTWTKLVDTLLSDVCTFPA